MGSGIMAICLSDGVFYSYWTNCLDGMNDTFLVKFFETFFFRNQYSVSSNCSSTQHQQGIPHTITLEEVHVFEYVCPHDDVTKQLKQVST